MQIRPDLSMRVTEICRDELDCAIHRIEKRLSEIEFRPAETGPDAFEGIRRFYQELTEQVWTEPDEAFLSTMSKTDPRSIKQMIRDGYRHSPVMPIPAFAYIIHLARKLEANGHGYQPGISNAVSAADRERLANLLEQQLREAAEGIISALKLSQPNCEQVLQRLEAVQGQIISELSPLV